MPSEWQDREWDLRRLLPLAQSTDLDCVLWLSGISRELGLGPESPPDPSATQDE